MTYHTLIRQPAAVAGLIRIRASDPATAKEVRSAVSALARVTDPPGSTALGSGGLRRLRLGSARILYEVDDTRHAVHVLTVGPVRG